MAAFLILWNQNFKLNVCGKTVCYDAMLPQLLVCRPPELHGTPPQTHLSASHKRPEVQQCQNLVGDLERKQPNNITAQQRVQSCSHSQNALRGALRKKPKQKPAFVGGTQPAKVLEVCCVCAEVSRSLAGRRLVRGGAAQHCVLLEGWRKWKPPI